MTEDVNFLFFQIEQKRKFSSSFDGELPLGEGLQSALLLGRLQAGLVSGQSLADGAGLLGAEVEGDVLLALKQKEPTLRKQISCIPKESSRPLFLPKYAPSVVKREIDTYPVS